jgi:hypothetical protein
MFMLARVLILRLASDPITNSRHQMKVNGQAKMLPKLKTALFKDFPFGSRIEVINRSKTAK